MDTEKNADENAGDQDENESRIVQLVENSSLGTPEAKALRASVPDDVAARVVERARELSEPKRPACGVLASHDRHVLGSASAPIHCAGYQAPEDQELSYVAAFQLWQSENEWSSKYGTLVHHARVLARKLDKAGDEAPAATSSAYLQAISRLERMRPGAAQPAGDDGDGLTPPGQQPSLFDPMEG